MRRFAVLLVAVVLIVGCGSDSPTGPRSKSAEQTRSASADLRDRFLLDHNAGFNGGFTFRWVPPIPIFVITGDDAVDTVVMEQFLAWEMALAGAGGSPFYDPRPVTNFLPARGIILAIADLPGNVVGLGDPFSPLGQRPKGHNPVGAKLRELKVPAIRKLEIPELTSGSEIQRCALVLDPVLLDAPLAAFNSVLRHEVGHCLGFIGHVANRRSVMHPSACCPLAITADITRMMRTLYNNEPNTPVTR
jgi:hypothetical protein